jgi:hypothetical protein
MFAPFAPKTRKQFESELDDISREMEFEMVDDETEHARRRHVRALVKLTLEHKKGWKADITLDETLANATNLPMETTVSAAFGRLGVAERTMQKYKKQAMVSGGGFDVERVNFKDGRRFTDSDRMALSRAVAQICINASTGQQAMEQADVIDLVVRTDRKSQGKAPVTAGISKFRQKSIANRIQKMGVGFKGGSFKTAAQIREDVDVRNPVAHAVGITVAMTKYDDDGNQTRIPDRNYFNMDVTGNGIRLHYDDDLKFAYVKKAPVKGRQNHATVARTKGSKLVINQKLFSLHNGEGKCMEQVYVYKHKNAPADGSPCVVVLEEEAHDDKDITVLFVNKNLTNSNVVEWVVINRVLPYIEKFKDQSSHAVLTFDGDPDQLEAIRRIMQRLDPEALRLCKFNPSQTQNEQDADAGSQFKDAKTHIASAEATKFVKNSGQKIDRIKAALKTAPLDLSEQEALCYSEAVVRSDYAHSRAFTMYALRMSCAIVGHIPLDAEQIMHRHPQFARASKELQQLCLRAVQLLIPVFREKGYLVEEDFDDVGLPQTMEQAMKRAFNRAVKSNSDVMHKWRFTWLNFEVVVARINEIFDRKLREAEESARRAEEKTEMEELQLQYHLGDKFEVSEISDQQKLDYKWEDEDEHVRCRACGNWKATWVVGDLRRNLKDKAWKKFDGQQWCLFKGCLSHLASFRSEKKSAQDEPNQEMARRLRAYSEFQRFDHSELTESLKVDYGWEEGDEEVKCRCCGGWKSTWVVGDLRRQYKDREWKKFGTDQWCLLALCKADLTSFRSAAKAELVKEAQRRVHDEKLCYCAKNLDLFAQAECTVCKHWCHLAAACSGISGLTLKDVQQDEEFKCGRCRKNEEKSD